MANSFGAQATLTAGERSLELVRLDALAPEYDLERLPFTLRILLENVLRAEALGRGGPEEVRAIAGWDPAAEPSAEISFRPARILLQDFTGVPAIVDLAAMRDAMRELEGGLVDVVEVDTPAVLMIQTGINEPRYATLRAIPSRRRSTRSGRRISASLPLASGACSCRRRAREPRC